MKQSLYENYLKDKGVISWIPMNEKKDIKLGDLVYSKINNKRGIIVELISDYEYFADEDYCDDEYDEEEYEGKLSCYVYWIDERMEDYKVSFFIIEHNNLIMVSA